MVRKERLDWIDTAKGIGILLVMLGHCYLEGSFTYWFYSFHMALFFVLSGYVFTGQGKYIVNLKKKAQTLLTPYITMSIITMICNGLLAITHGSEYEIIRIIIKYIVQIRYTPLWFITCLFLSSQLMYLIEKLRNDRAGEVFWLICALVMYSLFELYEMVIGMELPWNADLSLLATAFMCLGRWLEGVKAPNLICSRKKWAAFGLFAVVSVACARYNYLNFGKTDWFDSSFGNPLLFFVAAVTGVLGIILISQKIKAPLLSNLGRNSLVFFGLHRIVIDLTFVMYNKLGMESVSGGRYSFFIALITVAIAILVLAPVNWIIIKYFPWTMGKLRSTGNRTK